MSAIGRFSDQLAVLMVEEGLNATQLGKRIGATTSVVTAWLDKGTLPEGRYLKKLGEEFKLNIHWLVTGEGNRAAPKENPKAAVDRQIGVELALAEVEGAVQAIRDRLVNAEVEAARKMGDLDDDLRGSKASPRRRGKAG